MVPHISARGCRLQNRRQARRMGLLSFALFTRQRSGVGIDRRIEVAAYCAPEVALYRQRRSPEKTQRCHSYTRRLDQTDVCGRLSYARTHTHAPATGLANEQIPRS